MDRSVWIGMPLRGCVTVTLPGRVLEVVMIALGFHENPAIRFPHSDHFAA